MLPLEHSYRVELLVENRVLAEIKSVEALGPVHDAPVLTDLRLSGRDTGLLIDFNVFWLKRGIRRLALNRKDAEGSERSGEER